MRELLGIFGAALLVLWVVAHMMGCALLERTPAAVNVDDYRKALAVCRSDGQKARSYAVYEACAKEADVHYGLALADGGVP